MAGNPQNYLAVIKVVGVGGGGVNAVNRMIDAGLKGVEFIAVNTDAQALLMSDADVKLDIGRELTRGLGAGSDPEVGTGGRRGAPRGDRGGARRAPTWCSSPPARAAAPAPARRPSSPRSPSAAARSPSVWSPGRSASRAGGVPSRPSRASRTLKEKVDTQIVIPNDRLLTVSNDKTSVLNAFKMADEVLLQGVQGITDLITTPGLINTDFADVKMIMSDAGSALMGIGYGSGEGRSLGRRSCRDLQPAARGVHRRRPGHPAHHRRWQRPRPVRGQRGRRGHPRRRPPRCQHHLRHRHRRRDGRRGPGHGHRRRVRSLGRRQEAAPGRGLLGESRGLATCSPPTTTSGRSRAATTISTSRRSSSSGPGARDAAGPRGQMARPGALRSP